MKKTILYLAAILILSVVFAVCSSADNMTTATLDSVTIHDDGSYILVSGTLSDSFLSNNEKVYLFRIPPGSNGDIGIFMPIAEVSADRSDITFTVAYDAKDLSAALCGYRMAISDGDGGYLPISGVVYPSNCEVLAANTVEYPSFSSKKGLQVQLTADAQLLGIKHTVVNAFFNELISDTEENSVEFLYGGAKYYINQTALNALDYRIRTYTDAGIHIYMNLLLSFDTSASAELYYSNAEGNSATMYAPNVSTAEGIKRLAAVMNFLAGRYSSPAASYGFCGSYIIGYEVNNEAGRNSAGIFNLKEYTGVYATLLRTADTAIRSAYRHARVYVSVSNQWNVKANADAGLFGAKEFLSELSVLCSDVPFGVAINPYPSDLYKTDFWNDTKALNRDTTEYVTMKNLDIFTDFLSTEEMKYNGQTRCALISEFGVSGKSGDDSEALQATAYAYAYYIAEQNDAIEAFIWHRHVDHAGEKELYYGLYSASELLLDPKAQKKIYGVVTAVDTEGEEYQVLLDDLLSYLPFDTWETLIGEGEQKALIRRKVIPVVAQESSDTKRQNTDLLFDFSQSLYSFYPSDNAQYIEQCEGESETFLRIGLIQVSSCEYMGAGGTISDFSRLASASSMTVRLRVTAETDMADIRVLLTGTSGEREMILDATATVKCGEWVDLIFPLSEFSLADPESCTIKLWTRCDSVTDGNLTLDAAYIALDAKQTTNPIRTVFLVLLVLAGIAALGWGIYLAVIKFRKSEIRR